jgi:phage tail-like protein
MKRRCARRGLCGGLSILGAFTLLLLQPLGLSETAYGQDPQPGLNEAEGLPIGFFTSVTGIGSENEIIEHKVVDPEGNEVIRKIPGRLIWSDVTLKRGITSNMDLWEWRKQVEDAQTEEARRNFIITLLDEELRSVAAWSFANGWPSKIEALETADQSTQEQAIESLTLTHEGMQRMQ